MALVCVLCPCAAVRAASPAPLSNAAACARLIKVTGLDHVHAKETKPGAKPWCDYVSDEEGDYAIMELHSDRVCADYCSSLVGWYAVDRLSGAIFEWDIELSRIGARVDIDRH